MSNVTHIFELNTEAVEHHLISKSANLIITTRGTAGEENTYMASEWGEYNHVEGFETGTDKIKVPLALIQALNPSTTIVAGALPTEKFTTDGPTADTLLYDSNVLSYSLTTDGGDLTALLTLDGTPEPTLAAADIEIV